MEMSGPRTGACIGASFHNDNNDITIADSSELLGFFEGVYCGNV